MPKRKYYKRIEGPKQRKHNMADKYIEMLKRRREELEQTQKWKAERIGINNITNANKFMKQYEDAVKQVRKIPESNESFFSLSGSPLTDENQDFLRKYVSVSQDMRTILKKGDQEAGELFYVIDNYHDKIVQFALLFKNSHKEWTPGYWMDMAERARKMTDDEFNQINGSRGHGSSRSGSIEHGRGVGTGFGWRGGRKTKKHGNKKNNTKRRR